VQVFGLPRTIIRNADAALRLFGAKACSGVAEERRSAVVRFRRAMRDGLDSHGAARAVGVSRATLYRWMKRPEPLSRRPIRVRQRQWSPELAQETERLRLDFPMWGRAKIGPLLRDQGFVVSDMTAGRIIAGMVRRGVVQTVPTARKACKTRRWTAQRRHAVRLPKGMKPTVPGGIVQIDTVFIQLGPENHIKHFTAYDPVAKWTVGQAARRATSHATARFLDKVIADMPFPVKAIQVDGGSEFKAEFEDACNAKGITLYELPPKRPQLNGAVERCNGAWRYEFYGVYETPQTLAPLNDMINSFQHLYNHHRPHGALGGKTPINYLRLRTEELNESHMS
jgi:putative transposase